MNPRLLLHASIIAPCLFFGCGKDDPTSPPNDGGTFPSGEIVFSMRPGCEHSAEPDIFKMNADGSGFTQLTFTPERCERSPVWSPDGARIAYITGATNIDIEVAVMNADGSGQQQLTVGLQAEWDGLAWSPDGRWILAGRCFFENGVAVIPSSGGPFDTLRGLCGFHYDDTRPWSPDSREIVFSRRDSIYAIDVATDATRLIHVGGIEPFWSCDGARVFFLTHEQLPDSLGAPLADTLWSVDRDGGIPTRCTALVGNNGVRLSPDCTVAAFAVPDELPGRIRSVGVTGCLARAYAVAGNRILAWSPDSRYVLLQHSTADPNLESLSVVDLQEEREVAFRVVPPACEYYSVRFSWKP